MFERPWQLSLEAEDRQDFKELQLDISEVVQNEDSLVDMLDSKWDWGQREDLENALEAYLESDFVKKLSDSELTYLKKILNMRQDQYWGYGSYVATDGLYDAEVVSVRVPTDWVDTFILTGLIGDNLSNQSKKLDRKLGELNQSPLETAILLGGLALAGSASQREPSSAYSGPQRDGLQPTTRVGATFHGDLMVSRETRFVHDAIDPLGIPRPFGPAIPEAMIGAYHSTEPGILAALLIHQAGRSDKNPLQNLHQKISQRLEHSRIISRGNFADYGDGDGEYEARLLAGILAGNGHERDSVLGSFIIQPGNYHQTMELVTTEEGVMFCCRDDREDKEPQDVFLLPNDEIEDFIVALFSNNLGRTSPDALRKVLDVIK